MEYKVTAPAIQYLNKASKKVRANKGDIIFIKNRLQAQALLKDKHIERAQAEKKIEKQINDTSNNTKVISKPKDKPDMIEVGDIVSISQKDDTVNATVIKVNQKTVKVELPDGEEISVVKTDIVGKL